MDRLAGQIPGLSVTTGDAKPGADQTLRVRGENSLSADNAPLIVLDGIPYNGSLSDIDPNIIESLSVLKDASAAAIYGSRFQWCYLDSIKERQERCTPSYIQRAVQNVATPTDH